MDLIVEVTRATPHLTTYVVIAVVACGALAPLAARTLGSPIWAAALPLLALAAVVVLTLTPSIDGGFGGRAHVCGTIIPSPLPPTDLLAATQRSLNVALFVPLGASVFIARGWVRRTAFAFLVLLLPAVVEFAQYTWSSLGRTCGFADVVDNDTGAVYGLLIGALAAVVVRLVRGGRNTATGSTSRAEHATTSP